MKKVKSTLVKLTPEQVRELRPLYDKLIADNEREPQAGGMIVAQVWLFDSGAGGLSCRYLDNETGKKIQKITNPTKVGKMVTGRKLDRIEEIFD